MQNGLHIISDCNFSNYVINNWRVFLQNQTNKKNWSFGKQKISYFQRCVNQDFFSELNRIRIESGS